MKRIILSGVLGLLCVAATGQVYKMEEVWSLGNSYLMFKKNIEQPDDCSFVLYDVKYYGEGTTNPFISTYFEGSPGEFSEFISGVKSLLDEYKKEDGVLTRICGRKVYRMRVGPWRGVYIFEKDERHFGGHRDRDIENMERNFGDYCRRYELLN